MAFETGDYLFHGTRLNGIEVLEPRQAMNGNVADGEPAVFATTDIDYAIFMALIGTNGWGGWDDRKYPGKGFYIYDEFVEHLTYKFQYVDAHVYFLNRSEFTESDNTIFRSSHAVKVLGSVAVGTQDLPANITILSEPHPSRLLL